MDILSDIRQCLDKLENSLKCPLCKAKCSEPVCIKTCGHYFCRKCLSASKTDSNCPKCGELYEQKHVNQNNMAKQCEKELTELQLLLMPAENGLSAPERCISPILPKQHINKQNSILYEDNLYHINFINIQTKMNAKGETPLHVACKKKNFDQVKTLIESKTDINVKDYAGWAPLHEAIQSQCMEIIEYLLKKHCLINIPGPDHITPLHQAAILENANIVELLLNYGANKNIKDYFDLKPEDSTKSERIKSIIKSHTSSTSHLNNIFEVYLSNKISLYCHSVDEEVKMKLMACNAIEVLNKVDCKKKLTHFVIMKSHKLSFKIMQAMLEGLQFVTQDLVDQFIEGNYFINIPEHTFITSSQQLNTGIQRAMMSAILKLPKLFDGINFYIEDHTKSVQVYNLQVNKEYLMNLIKAGGGKVLQRPPATRTCEFNVTHPYFASEASGTCHCGNFIIFDNDHPPDLVYKMSELQHRSSKWLVDCIIKYEISDND